MFLFPRLLTVSHWFGIECDCAKAVSALSVMHSLETLMKNYASKQSTLPSELTSECDCNKMKFFYLHSAFHWNLHKQVQAFFCVGKCVWLLEWMQIFLPFIFSCVVQTNSLSAKFYFYKGRNSKQILFESFQTGLFEFTLKHVFNQKKVQCTSTLLYFITLE